MGTRLWATRRRPTTSTNVSRPWISAWLVAGRLAATGLLPAALLVTPIAHAAERYNDVMTGRSAIDLSVGEGRIVHFDGAISSVYVADSAAADVQVVSTDTVYVYGKRPGMTNLIALSNEQRVRATIQLRIGANAAPVNVDIGNSFHDSKIEASFAGGQMNLKGKAKDIDEAMGVQGIGEGYAPTGGPGPKGNSFEMDGANQVNIRVRFVEVSRNDMQALGLDWQILGGSSLSLQKLTNSININVMVDALNRKGVLNVLAEPNLTAVTGQTAHFQSGGEVPVPIVQPGGTTSIEYKPYGISLDFTPTIIKSGRIALHIRPEVSMVANGGNTQVQVSGTDMPSFITRRADTTVEAASGQTFAIAGLFQRQMSQDLNRVPGLGDVPGVGALFGTERFRRTETELVILITPFLVRPVSDHSALATPLDPPAMAPDNIYKASPPSRPSGSNPSTRHASSNSGFVLK